MKTQAFLEYMGVLCGGEAAKYACEEAIQELNNQLAAVRDPYPPVMPDRYDVTRGVVLRKSRGAGTPGCIVAVFAYCVIAAAFDTIPSITFAQSNFAALIAMAIIFGIYALIRKGIDANYKKQHDNEAEALWQQAVAQHDSQMAVYSDECARNIARRSTLQHMIEGYNSARKKIENELSMLYSKNIIPERFRNMVAVNQIREYIQMGVCNKLKGPDGAFAQYLQDLRAEKICNSIADMKREMLRSLDRIAAYQGSILNEIRITNANLESFSRSVSASLERIESGMDGLSRTMSIIGAHTAETNAHARNIERIVRDSAYNNYIVQRYNNMHEYAVIHALRDPR